MWPFNRKKKNRRNDSGRKLDVKRAPGERLAKLRMVLMALLISALTLGGAYGAWVGAQWVANEFIYKNESFAIQSIEIETDGEIPLFLLQRWIGVVPGENLLALDLARIKRNLELVSLVERAAVERVLPATLRVRVTEREPVAQVTIYQRPESAGPWRREIFHFDSKGHVIAPLSTPLASDGARAGLPSITGIQGTELRPGHAVESPGVHSALEFVELYKRSPMARLVGVSGVDVSRAQVLVVTTDEGSEITFSVSGLLKQLNRWHLVHEYGREIGRRIATLDLSIPNHVPARWLPSDWSGATSASETTRTTRKDDHV